MMRPCALLFASGLLFRSTSAQADIVFIESMASKLEPIWGPIFGGGIVFGLVLFAVLKVWRTINRTRRR